ncbi:uncharacterized protein LOC109861979 [Pseudomyrmex gracilis]|uniref:uncharacterized protein LOC109861979 n=1 Tax=Pseudomyrmex gracilis TaxID=219809 RepID=UPI000995A7EF|nr:uncharacterized protein LOC109861979 [Pseudomyrmex gracilis]
MMERSAGLACVAEPHSIPVSPLGQESSYLLVATTLWGARLTNIRGTVVEDWATSLDLTLLNSGSLPTCIRPQGSSIVDLTWCSADVASRVPTEQQTGRQTGFSRWAWKNVNPDLMRASVILKDWLCPQPTNCAAEAAAVRFGQLLTEACDAAAPRSKRPPTKRQTYWWNSNLIEMRRKCISLRRKLVRYRRLKNLVDAEISRTALRDAQRALRAAIAEAKKIAWQELISTLNEDPWGRPYRAVMLRLKTSTVTVTESLEEHKLNNVIRGLFPQHERTECRLTDQLPAELTGVFVTLEEIMDSLKSIKR